MPAQTPRFPTRIEEDYREAIEETNLFFLLSYSFVMNASQGPDSSFEALRMFSAEIASHAWTSTMNACS
jgi:hypothetical protein